MRDPFLFVDGDKCKQTAALRPKQLEFWQMKFGWAGNAVGRRKLWLMPGTAAVKHIQHHQPFIKGTPKQII